MVHVQRIDKEAKQVPIVKAATADQTKKGTTETKPKDTVNLMEFMLAAGGDMS